MLRGGKRKCDISMINMFLVPGQMKLIFSLKFFMNKKVNSINIFFNDDDLMKNPFKLLIEKISDDKIFTIKN